MNAPTGFDVVNGQPVNINPIAAMLNPALEFMHASFCPIRTDAIDCYGRKDPVNDH
jgi:hypothetical protein